jgi:hypothetical protein
MADCTTCTTAGAISIFSGRDYTAKFTLTTSTGGVSSPFDLTGALLWLTVKTTPDDLDENAIVSKANLAAGGADAEILITDAAGGEVEVYFVPADTAGVDGNYWYDLVVEVGGKRMQAVAPSQFNIKETVTNFDAS